MKRFRHAVQSLHANYSHSTLGHLKRKTAITMSSTSQSNHKKLKRQDPHYTHTFYWAIPASVVHACNLYWEVPMLQASLVHVPCIGQYWPPLYMYLVLGNTGLPCTCTLYWAILASLVHVPCIGQYWPPLYRAILASLVHVPCIGQYWPPLYMYLVLGNTSHHSTCTLYWAIPASILPVLCIGQYWPPFYMYFVLGNTGILSTCTLYSAILASFLHVLCTGQCQHCRPPFYVYFVLGNVNTAGLPSHVLCIV